MFRKASNSRRGPPLVGKSRRRARCSTASPTEAARPTPAPWNWRRGSSPSTRNMAINQAQAAYYATRLRRGDRARQCIENALATGTSDNEVHYYVGLAELGLGDRERAVLHVRRARELGCPEVIPEFGAGAGRHPKQDLNTGRTNMPIPDDHRAPVAATLHRTRGSERQDQDVRHG